MKLFEPITIRGTTFKNRIVYPPANLGLGLTGRRGRTYYAERARGGAGAITTPPVLVDAFSDEAWGKPGSVQSFIERLRTLTDEVHKFGAKIGAQLLHLNRFPTGLTGDDTKGDLVAPSPDFEQEPPLMTRTPGERPRELTIPEIESIIEKYAKSAAGAKAGGYDLVNVHSAHLTLPCQFWAPASNHRTDKYGGDLAGRMRFGIEVVTAIRAAVGDSFPIFFRLGAEGNGVTIEDCIVYARELAKAGVDVIDVSTTSSAGEDHIPGPDRPIGTFVHLAEQIKKNVDVTVAAVGRIKRPEFAEAILAEGKADLIYMGRALIADPGLPDKAAQGKYDEIVPCISCNVCEETVPTARGLRCSVNAAVIGGPEYQLKPAEKSKKVIVVGGGPAGMEAARVAALRGHQVTLYEKKGKLGGLLRAASVAPYKDETANLTEYLTRQLEKAGVTVKLGVEATAELVREKKPEAVVIATGANPLLPEKIPGIKGKNVVNAVDVLTGAKKVGRRVVIIGGGMVGSETALFLAQKGKKVTILEMLDEIGSDIGEATRETVLYHLRNAGIEMFTKAKAEEITERGVRATRNNSSQVFEADTVVLAVGFTPNTELAQKLEGKVAALYPIGDCVEPRKIVDAIDDGNRVGRGI